MHTMHKMIERPKAPKSRLERKLELGCQQQILTKIQQ